MAASNCAVRRGDALLAQGQVPVVATIACQSVVLIAEAKKQPKVQIEAVTKRGRQTLPRQIATWVKQRTAPANTP